MNLLEAYNEIQKAQNFKDWFGKSVLHTKGKPHTFYHGTDADIESFSHAHIGNGNDEHGAGFYFSDDTNLASSYTNHGKHGGNVIPVHLKVEKPIYTSDDKGFSRTHIEKIIKSAPNHKESLNNFGDVDYEGYQKVLKGAVDVYTDIPKHKAIHGIANDFYRSHSSEFLTALTKHTGHDAVIHKPHKDLSTIINVFHPNQIKSAIGNNGEYSKYTDKITEAFDKPLDKTEVPQDSMLHTMGSMSAAMVGGDNFSMHKLKGSGYMVQFDKEGATELHHVDDDLQGGYLKHNQPSMRLIGTYREHIQNLLESGRRVRIVAHDRLAGSFHRIASRLVSKHPEYSITEPKEDRHEITGDKLQSWELSKNV